MSVRLPLLSRGRPAARPLAPARALGLPLALVLSGCASLAAGHVLPGTEYLPPPPKAMSPIGTMTQQDTLLAMAEEEALSLRVRDSLRAVRSGRPWLSDSTARARAVGAQRRGVGGLLRPRFGGSTAYPEADAVDRETQLLEEREARRGAATGWSRVDDTEATMLLHESWGMLRSVLRSGQPVTTRHTVWPADVHVSASPTPERIRMESAWIPLARIAPNELQCVVHDPAPARGAQDRPGVAGAARSADTLHTPVVGRGVPSVRLIAVLQAAEWPGRTAVTSGTEFRGVYSCAASPVWADRVAEFGSDAWMGAERAMTLGGMPLIAR